VLRDSLAHDRHFLDAIVPISAFLPFPPYLSFLFLASDLTFLTAVHESEEIILCHSSTDAGAMNERDVDVVVLGKLPYQR